MNGPYTPVPPIDCADGLSLSVQAGSALYCDPRVDFADWTSVEVGFPSEKIDELMPYIDGNDEPTENVYAQVPIELVVDIINAHGGEAQS